MPLTEAAATLLGAGLGAIGTIGGTGIGAAANSNLNKKNMNFQREMYNQQRADALADYSMQMADFRENREYNSIGSQMQRAKAAGVNPMSVVGGATQQTGNPSASVASSTPTAPATNPYDFSGIGQAMGQLSAGIVNASEIDLAQQRIDVSRYNLDVQRMEIYARAVEALSGAKNLDADTQNKILKNMFDLDTYDSRVAQVNADLQKTLQSTQESFHRTVGLMFDNAHLKPAQLEKLNKGLALIDAQIADYASLAAYREQLVKTGASQEELNRANAELSRTEESLKRYTGGNNIVGAAFGLSNLWNNTFGNLGSQVSDYVSGQIDKIKSAYGGFVSSFGNNLQGYSPTIKK